MEAAKSLLCWEILIRELDFSQDDLETQKLGSNSLQAPLLTTALLPCRLVTFSVGGLHLAQFGRLRIPRMCDALGSVRGQFTGRGFMQTMEVEA